MQLVFHQSGNASKDLALDEALLESAPWRRQQSHASHGEVLRLWHFVQPTLILGRASRFREEVNLEYCQRNGIPILRRCTGGASVVAGPGCLIYSLILNQQHRPEMEDITHVHRFVAQNLHSAMQS
ncbi:MAG: lipoate--protein ligase family protein, partial [Planctomycetota bacterium]